MNSLAALLTLFMAVPLFARLGDLNNDGDITLTDCKLLATQVASGKELVDLTVSDIDGNGKLTIVDAMRLHQTIGGLWLEPTGKIPPVPQVSADERAYFARYEEQCDKYEGMTPDAFKQQFAAAPLYSSTLEPQKCTYFSQIESALKLTTEQKVLLKEKGMVVLGNGRSGLGFGKAYADIFVSDLPVFFTSDALLEPLYRLYDDALKAVELSSLIPSLSNVLSSTLSEIDRLKSTNSTTAWSSAIADAETYLLVAQSLLDGVSSCAANSEVDRFLKLIAEQQLVISPFFGSTLTIDFTQFKPRGHYECTSGGSCEKLPKYFKCMMWLGRADCAFNIDSLRQLRAFTMIHTAMQNANAIAPLSSINETISAFVGDVDGFSVEGMSNIASKKPYSPDSIMVSDNAAKSLLASIKISGGANQLILSQAMWKAPDAARPDLPVIAQLCGQRFILDSYLLGRTVEWYVQGRNKPLLEEVPFCLGNNAATSVAASDISSFTTSKGDYKPYHARLGAARTLFENYPYWDRNLYSLWLDGLRSLSKPLPSTVPVVMRSRSWQDKQMNTQLASWAQLRHNTLLYAKQSYTGGITCFYPDGYVEPYPEFYRTIGTMIKRLAALLPSSVSSSEFKFNSSNWLMVTDSLASMAELECAGKPLTKEHITFLNEMLVMSGAGGCGPAPYTGWYVNLYKSWDDCQISRPCIADIHTIPPSDIQPANMVLHAATGDASTIIVQAATGNDCGTLYVGAVSSFYQHDKTPIARLADSEWTTLLHGATKPGVPAWYGSYVR